MLLKILLLHRHGEVFHNPASKHVSDVLWRQGCGKSSHVRVQCSQKRDYCGRKYENAKVMPEVNT
jgi:hypothetical protein